jgi:hypothetical protein
VILENQEVLRSGRAGDAGEATHRRAGHVHDHRHAVLLRHIPDLVRLEDSTRRLQIRLNDIDRMLAAQDLEGFLEVDVLTGQGGHFNGVGDLLPKFGVIPRDEVLHPRQIEFLERLPEPDARIHPDVPEVVRGDGDLPADDFTDFGQVVRHHGDALVGDLQSGEHMHQVARNVRSGRVSHGARRLLDHSHTDIHLEEGEALLDAELHPLAENFLVGRLRSVRIDANGVAEFAPPSIAWTGTL